MLDDVFKGLSSVEEGNFRYYEIDKNYEVSINTIDPNTEIPMHEHEQDVHNYVFSGQITVVTTEGKKNLTKGDWLFVPAGMKHAVKTNESVFLLEFWKK